MSTIYAIMFAEEELIIEYVEEDSNPITQQIQLRIPYRVAELMPQLKQDLDELTEDAYTLLESAKAARVGATSAPQGMGRE